MPHKLLLLALLLLLQACSAVKLGYNNADSLLYWRLDSYVDFSDEQAPRVRAEIAQFHRWHRHEQLPVYADTLQRIAPQLQANLSPEQSCSLVDQVRSALAPTLDPVHWPLLGLAAQMSEEQFKHLERKQATSNIEWREKWLDVTPAELAQVRFDEVLSRSEMLYGSLGETQRAAIRAGLSVAPSAFDGARSLAQRVCRQQDLVQVMRRIKRDKLAPPQALAAMTAYMARMQEAPDPADRRYLQGLVNEGCAVFSRLHNATTPAQRAKAQQTLKNYEDDLRLLAAQR